jgi:hypothetical protein
MGVIIYCDQKMIFTGDHMADMLVSSGKVLLFMMAKVVNFH